MSATWSLFLDDCRPCPVAPSWVLATSALQAIELVKRYGSPKRISLDYDLDLFDPTAQNAMMFVKEIPNLGLTADTIYLHTGNPDGRREMFALLQHFKQAGVLRKTEIVASPMLMYNLATGEPIID